jgi:PAS domain S-box-containing protein
MSWPKWKEKLARVIHNPHFWLVLASFNLIVILHYSEQIGIFGTEAPSLHFGLTRHAMDRILFLVPIIYSGFAFGLKGGLAVSFAAAAAMLPRAALLSPVPPDAYFEVGAVTVVGVLACLWINIKESERKKQSQALEKLEQAHQLLQKHIRVSRANEKRLTTMNAISTVLTESLELEEVLRRAIELVMEVMSVEAVLIFSLNEESKELELMVYEGVSEEFARDVSRMKLGEGFNGRVAQTGEPLIVEDASRDSRLTKSIVKKMKLQAQLIVPLKSKGRVIGTLCVAMRRPRQFLPPEVELLVAIGNQLGISLENVRLYKKQRLIAEQLSTSERNYRGLFEGANDAIWVHDLRGNVISANMAAEKLTGYTLDQITTMNVASLLGERGLIDAREVRQKLLSGEPFPQPYEQRLIRKDGTEAIFMLSSSLVTLDGKIGFQHIARDVTEEKRMQENLRFYVQEVTQVQEEERKRIARELHDDTTQNLYGILRQMDNFVRSSTSLTQDDMTRIKGLRQQVEDALQGVRRFTQDLRPSMLDDLGLLPALGWLVKQMNEHSIKTDLTVIGDHKRLSPATESTIFRIVQEALNNIRKHAGASAAEVKIEFGRDGLNLTVTDNGSGFELPKLVGDLTRSGKLGLVGMQERALLLGGSVKVDSQPGKGTAVRLHVP